VFEPIQQQLQPELDNPKHFVFGDGWLDAQGWVRLPALLTAR
jgi:hypothetical protein